MRSEPGQLDQLEVAVGVPLGQARSVPPLVANSLEPVAAFEDSVRVALERPPCVVSFSGGRDSSAVLATAVRVARREGLPLPIPVTLRFPGVAWADERAWQEQVIRHLDIVDWMVLEFTDELDVLGTHARSHLDRHGVQWPPNTYFHRPVLDVARAGAVLTGIGGDDFFVPRGWPFACAVRSGHERRNLRNLAQLAVAFGPDVTRLPYMLARGAVVRPWLTGRARRLARWRTGVFGAGHRAGWSNATSWWWPSRYVQVTLRSFAAAADEFDVLAVHPFRDDRFLGAAMSRYGDDGPSDRTSGMRELFGDRLPAAVIERASKATFDAALWGAPTRDFVERWRGTGVDHRYVRPEPLLDAWRNAPGKFHSMTLVQQAWLSEEGGHSRRASTS